jgi:hypothetical protein
MKTIKYVFAISLSLLLLIALEGLCTLGTAFEFETYTIFHWICQFLGICTSVCLAIIIINEASKDE